MKALGYFWQALAVNFSLRQTASEFLRELLRERESENYFLSSHFCDAETLELHARKGPRSLLVALRKRHSSALLCL